MCGISLILSGVHISGSDFFTNHSKSALLDYNQVHEPELQIDNLKSAVQRRGPDNLGHKKFFLLPKCKISPGKEDERTDDMKARDCIVSSFESTSSHDAEIEVIGATLQLRGLKTVNQPLEDISGNILVYNGEIFGGLQVPSDSNDGQALMLALETSCSYQCSDIREHKGIPDILSTIRGPWALVYWQEKSKTLWFGRDPFGRRSLLVHWPTTDDSRLILSSVSATLFKSSFDSEAADAHAYWEELPCGIYSIQLNDVEKEEFCTKEKLQGQVMKHSWTDSLLNKLIRWERNNVDPNAKEISVSGLSLQKNESQLEVHRYLMNKCTLSGGMLPVQRVLIALRESVMRRTVINSRIERHLEENKDSPVALLFSGGLDSMILAALLDQCLDPRCIIDLLNVSFDGQLAPDRISARLGVKELQKIAPSRRWRLVEIDTTLSSLSWETEHVMSLIHPAKTYMDLNIGIALWLAAKGDGWVDGELCNNLQNDWGRYQYKSTSRILLVGSGADEQCAGYGRHKTKYRNGGWSALQVEMRLDMQRIWKRNLGRDDRCIADHGKEARFPFLDEDVINTLLEIPLWEIANLDEPSGIGDKKILREAARYLGIEGASTLPKRAIQFGSRIARESNRKNFGSNRAANQASAGSVEIFGNL